MSEVQAVIDALKRLQAEAEGEIGHIRSTYPAVDFEAGFEWLVPLQPVRHSDPEAGER